MTTLALMEKVNRQLKLKKLVWSESVKVDNADVQDSKPEVKVFPDIVDVYALAIFEHCPYENLTQDDMDSLGRFNTSKDHLQRNIANFQILHVYNNGANAVGTFDHEFRWR